MEAESTDDEILKWGCTFSDDLKEAYPDAKWYHWAAANEYDFNAEDPEGPGIPLTGDQINYNPYLGEPGVENPNA